MSRFQRLRNIRELASLSGLEFEDYLSRLFSELGYSVIETPASGDFGADLILEKDKSSIAVQAKRYSSKVGFDAVKEVYFAKSFYRTDEAWVISTDGYTAQAEEAAFHSGVKLIDAPELEMMIIQAEQASTGTEHNLHKGRQLEPEFDIAKDDEEEGPLLNQYHGASSEVVIPDGIRKIGPSAFADIKNRVTNSANGLHKPYCKAQSIVSVSIPNTVTEISERAFFDCVNLSSCPLPPSLSVIGDLAFHDCSLTRVDMLPSIVYGDEVYSLCRNLRAVRVSEGVETIPRGSFWRCLSLVSVELASTVKRIEDHAFYSCESLREIDIPEGVEDIGPEAFSGCKSLTSIVLPNSLKRLAISAFDNCPAFDDGSPFDFYDLSGVTLYSKQVGDLSSKNSRLILEQQTAYCRTPGLKYAVDFCHIVDENEAMRRELYATLEAEEEYRQNVRQEVDAIKEQRIIARENYINGKKKALRKYRSQWSEIDTSIQRREGALYRLPSIRINKRKELVGELELLKASASELAAKVDELSSRIETLRSSIPDFALEAESDFEKALIGHPDIEALRQTYQSVARTVSTQQYLREKLLYTGLFSARGSLHIPKEWLDAGRVFPHSMVGSYSVVWDGDDECIYIDDSYRLYNGPLKKKIDREDYFFTLKEYSVHEDEGDQTHQKLENIGIQIKRAWLHNTVS